MEQNTLRKPAVAGTFYPGTAATLAAEIAKHMEVSESPATVLGVASPHAGLMYSGPVAGALFGAINVPERVVVLCPKHHWDGAEMAIMTSGMWELPGFSMQIDAELAGRVMAAAHGLSEDHRAHAQEHSLEVQLPFIHARNPAARIVPIALGHIAQERCMTLGLQLAAALGGLDDVLVVASTDMSHHIPAQEARRLDDLAIKRVLALDPEGLYAVVHENHISMCGVVPTTVMLAYARARQAREAVLVKYATSGDVTGDNARVVGYAGIYVQ